MKRESCAPLIFAVTLLLLPLLYVGGYLALVLPEGRVQSGRNLPPSPEFPNGRTEYEFAHYRIGCKLPAALYYPLEQIDRKLRPGSWEPPAPLSPLDDDFKALFRSLWAR